MNVSIVIPVYNVEKYLARCLDSCISQTMKDGVEVICINDGSTDSSPDILKEYEEKYPDFIRVYTIKNDGVSHARNFGVEKASGDYILFADSDDFLEPDVVEKLYTKAMADGSDVVICRYYDVREKSLTGTIIRTESKVYATKYEDNFDINEYKFELTHISPFPWDKLYKRELILKYPFPEGIRFEDLSIMYPMMLSAKRIGVIKDRLYNYRRASTGSFLNTFSEGTLDIVKSLKNLVDRTKADGHFESFKEEIEYICIRHILVRFDVMFNFKGKNNALSENNRGNLSLKEKMIDVCMDFLEGEFPDWRENRYLKYSSSAKTKRLLPFYESKQKMLKFVRRAEKTPLWMLKKRARLIAKRKRTKRKWKEFWARKHKWQYITTHWSFFKIFNRPRDVEYTKYYLKLPILKNTVLFESKHGQDVAGNMFYMMKAMDAARLKEYADFKIYIPLSDADGFQEHYDNWFKSNGMKNINIITIDSKEYLMLLAQAEYLLTDTSFPSYYIKKEGQHVLNTWHGTPLKAMGRVVPQREYALGNVQRNFMFSDVLLYQNRFSMNSFIDDYMLRHTYKGKILLSGYPRNSAFFNYERYDEIREELEISDKQVFAYMPTWRGLLNKKQNKQQIAEIAQYLYKIDEALNDDQIFYVKLHPFVKQGISYDDYTHIEPFPEQYETYDFLNATDALVTDYSSIMFDYAVSGKKIVLFTYDREQYLKERGMYIDINKLEFPIADDVDTLVDALNDDSAAEEARAAISSGKVDLSECRAGEYLPGKCLYPEFRKLYLSHDSKKAASDVCDYFFLGKVPENARIVGADYSYEEGKPVIDYNDLHKKGMEEVHEAGVEKAFEKALSSRVNALSYSEYEMPVEEEGDGFVIINTDDMQQQPRVFYSYTNEVKEAEALAKKLSKLADEEAEDGDDSVSDSDSKGADKKSEENSQDSDDDSAANGSDLEAGEAEEELAFDGRKRNVLIFINGIKKDKDTVRRIRSFNKLDTTKYNFYFAFKAKNGQEATRRIGTIRKKLDYMPLMYDVNYTFGGRFSCFLSFKLGLKGKWIDSQLDRLAEIEGAKYFGGTHFDIVLNYSNLDNLILLMCPKLAPISIYNAATFKKSLYDGKKRYRKRMNFAGDHIDNYTFVTGKKGEIENFPGGAVKSGKVKVLDSESYSMNIYKTIEKARKEAQD